MATTLLLLGENSPVELTAPSRVLASALPDSRIAVREGQEHVAMTTAPQLLLREVMGVLSN